MPELLPHCTELMQKGSSSFTFAARLFPLRIRESAALLYGWCRYCDDQIDEVADRDCRSQRLVELEDRLNEVGTGKNDFERLPFAFRALSAVSRMHQIPLVYAHDLLRGMRMDVESRDYETLDELKEYAYCVAGTVGLMMSHVMGVSQFEALGNAVDLGIAMQLTNIARDIREDALRGRVYLPKQWLREEGLTEADLREGRNLEAIARLTKRLVMEADQHYLRGNNGIRYLPVRCALPIAVASGIYREIGHIIVSRGISGWQSRAFTPFSRKLWVATWVLIRFMKHLPGRWLRPWANIKINEVWRYTP